MNKINLVNQILALKQSAPTAAPSDLEHQIDKCRDAINRVSTGLSEEEIKIVEN